MIALHAAEHKRKVNTVQIISVLRVQRQVTAGEFKSTINECKVRQVNQHSPHGSAISTNPRNKTVKIAPWLLLRIHTCNFSRPYASQLPHLRPSFMKSPASSRCKRCRIRNCPRLVAAWRKSRLICSIFPCLRLSGSGTERSPRTSGGSLRLQALKRKSFPLLRQVCTARKE